VKKILLVILMLSLSVASLIPLIKDQSKDTTDAACVSDCKQRGYDLGYCKQRCNLDQDDQAAMGQMSDPKCLNNCENAGRGHDYCKKTCTY